MLQGFLYEQILFLWVMAAKPEPSGSAWLPFASYCFGSFIVVAKWDIIIRDPPTLCSFLEVKFWIRFSDKSSSTVRGNVIYVRIKACIWPLISWCYFAQPDNRKAYKMKMHTALTKLWNAYENRFHNYSWHFAPLLPVLIFLHPHTLYFFLILAWKLIWSLPRRS